MDTKFPSKKLNLFVTGSYTVTRSLVDSDIISLSSFLIWRIGLISLETGVQTNRSASTSATGTNALLSTYYYATLRRALF
jgi:hypothetical protein